MRPNDTSRLAPAGATDIQVFGNRDEELDMAQVTAILGPRRSREAHVAVALRPAMGVQPVNGASPVAAAQSFRGGTVQIAGRAAAAGRREITE
jgi:hypothetical protein